MDNNDGKNLYDEMLEIFKNKNYDVKDFVETLEMDSIEKKLDEALIELKNKFKDKKWDSQGDAVGSYIDEAILQELREMWDELVKKDN